MDEQQYLALVGYVGEKMYPPDYKTKSRKFVLRRASKNYILEGDQLMYVDRKKNGSTFNRLVLRGSEMVDRVFLECHLTTGGHRGRDATIGKIKERYYWPSYYKDIEERVGDLGRYFD